MENTIDNKQRKISWETVAKEMQSSRDALQKDLYLMQEQRDINITEITSLRERVAALEAENARLIDHIAERDDRVNRVLAMLERAEAERDEFSRSIDKICTERDGQLVRVCRERDALRAENDALRQDALRYRWLRDKAEESQIKCLALSRAHVWDDAIDYSMKYK